MVHFVLIPGCILKLITQCILECIQQRYSSDQRWPHDVKSG